MLETTFRTAAGSVRVTDAMTVAEPSRRELVRIVDAREGRVPMRWRFEPRLDFGRGRSSVDLHLRTWDAGEDSFELAPGGRATFALRLGSESTSRDEVERDVERSSAFWMDWSGRAQYHGPWREAVVRSALVLKLLQFEPTGAIVAAPTTSLPERIGGRLNWGYRFSWLRDGIYTMRALLHLGYVAEAEAFFRWQLAATRPTAPEVTPLYCVDGSVPGPEEEIDLPGYRSSRPVRVGNAATEQLQLDNYGHLLESASRLRGATGSLGSKAGAQLASFADFVADAWRRPDAGIWEVRDGLRPVEGDVLDGARSGREARGGGRSPGPLLKVASGRRRGARVDRGRGLGRAPRQLPTRAGSGRRCRRLAALARALRLLQRRRAALRLDHRRRAPGARGRRPAPLPEDRLHRT